ncbi:MAG: glycosyltransferase family 8 protein [Helicobacteraceae bacterium]|nr:glycosyltransferase family 8 protein [Helicobacteraceae bacterium]
MNKQLQSDILISPVQKEQDSHILESSNAIASQMHIFFASDDKFAQHLSVAITSIVKNMLSCDRVNFYVLDGGISDKNKKKLSKLESKSASIEYIAIDEKLFAHCPINPQGASIECKHVGLQAYYRYLIPKLKPDLEKVLYLDCDLVANASLNDLWNTELGDNYVGAVEDTYKSAKSQMKIKVDHLFNSGVMLINNKKWVKDKISDLLFENTKLLFDKIVYVDQDVLNYTFRNKIYWLEPRYNLQQNAWFDGQRGAYSDERMEYARSRPVIAHFNGPNKPWDRYYKCRYKHKKLYGVYLRQSPFFLEWIRWNALRFIHLLIHKQRKPEQT